MYRVSASVHSTHFCEIEEVFPFTIYRDVLTDCSLNYGSAFRQARSKSKSITLSDAKNIEVLIIL